MGSYCATAISSSQQTYQISVIEEKEAQKVK